MPADADPFAALSWSQRVGLRRRLRRSWREGLAERKAATLATVRVELVGALVADVDHRGTITEVRFAGDSHLRLLSCHRPTVRALRSVARDGDVRLVQADHHGYFWGLYFQSLEGRLPLLARELRVVRDSGGRGSTPSARAPAPSDRAPLAVG